jgi:hypothetical protein
MMGAVRSCDLRERHLWEVCVLQYDQIPLHEHQDPTWREVSIGFVSTYPPTQCGLATFTAATRAAISSRPGGGRTGVVQIVDGQERSRRPEVMGWLHTSDSASRRRAAAALRNFDVTVVQHEFGIYGGRDGEHVVDLLDELTTPRIVVLHTVLSAPSAPTGWLSCRGSPGRDWSRSTGSTPRTSW